METLSGPDSEPVAAAWQPRHHGAVEITLLGRFALCRDGRQVADAAYGGRRVRQLVRMLAIQRGRVITRGALIDALWGERLPADPAANLNVVVNRARRALGDAGALQTVGGGYRLSAGPETVVDVETFERDVAEARATHARGELGLTLAAATRALDLWETPLPDDLYAEWARPHRDRLERVHQEALELAASVSLATGQPQMAVAHAAEAVVCQPLREAAHLLLIRALASSGDQAAALTAYLDFRHLLADELGVDPTAEAVALYDQLLNGSLPAPPARPRLDRQSVPLVGRDAELRELATLSSDRRVAVVAGRSGSGKSRLLEELVTGTDRPALFARALLPEREEPWSVLRSLVEVAPPDAVEGLDATTRAALSGILPGLPAPATQIDGESSRALIRQGLVRVIESTAPSLIIVDDLQWADSSSLDVLVRLISREADLIAAVAYRPEEVADDSAVARCLTMLRQQAPVEISVGPLDADSLRGLVASPPVAAALAEHTDGTPFAVLQVARILEREGLTRRDTSGIWNITSETTEDAAAQRVREVARAGKRDAVWRQFLRQPPSGQDLLACLALLGRPAPARLLSEVFAGTVDTMGLLRDLSRAHLVRHAAQGFRVEHDLVGEVIRDRLDSVERVRLHHLLVDALERAGAPAEVLALHLAGAGEAAAAAAAYATSARARLDRFADREAGDLAAQGLKLDPPVDVRADLLEVRAETRARHGDLDAARADLRDVLAGTASRTERSRLLSRLATLTAGSDDLLRAAELANLALAEAADDPGARARALHTRALIDMNLGHVDVSKAGFDAALELFTATGDAAGMADILDARAHSTFGFRNITAGVRELDRVARLFVDRGALLRAVFPRSTCGHGRMFAGQPAGGLVDTTQALELARKLGNAEGEAMTLWHHAEVLVACGRVDDAMTAAEQGLALARQLGHRAATAMTLLALGVARRASGDFEGAAAAFEESIEESGEPLVMFRCWGHARLALALLDQGRSDEAALHVAQALAIGPELSQYEARFAQCALAVHRGDADAGALVDDALRRAVAGGHQSSATLLRELATRPLPPPTSASDPESASRSGAAHLPGSSASPPISTS